MQTMQAISNARVELESLRGKHKKEIQEVPMLDDNLIELFRKISLSHGSQLEGWAECLTQGELEVLSDYIYKSGLPAIPLVQVFAYTDNYEYMDRIYRGWQQSESSPEDRTLLAILADSRELSEKFKASYQLSPKDMLTELDRGELINYLVDQAGLRCNGTYGGYMETLEVFGLSRGGYLYNQCIKRYLMVCNGKSYMEAGYDDTRAFFDRLDDGDRRIMAQNMIKNMDEFQLRSFVAFAPVFRDMIGDEGSPVYREMIEPLPETCRYNYRVMQNQFLIYEVLGNNERAAFWMTYADKGTIRVYESINTLLIEFTTFTAIEFRNREAAYFFNNEYMKDRIIGNISSQKSEESFDEWLYNNTEWSLDKDHQYHWRKAHVGNWELDMKTYMSRNLRK